MNTWPRMTLLLVGMLASFGCTSLCGMASPPYTNDDFSASPAAGTILTPSGIASGSTAAPGFAGDGYCPSVFIPISLALVVGVCGAWCFYSGVRYGLIDRNSRDAILKHLPNKEIPILFCMLGGIVAAVFQAAQPHVFAPIQAFVLGATWPSVVTRIMSGSGSGASLTDMAPQDIKPPPGSKTATPEPEVVIKP